MKTRSVNSGFWFWHKGCVKTMTFCNRTDSKFGSHQLICRPKCCSRTEIQFVLACRYLVEGRLNVDSHFFESQHHIAPRVFSQVQRSKIQITAFVVRYTRCSAVLIGVEQEKFTLR